LSLFLRCIDVNDVIELNIDINCEVEAYADAECVVITGSKVASMERLAISVFERFIDWASNNNFTFDMNKTETILFNT